MNADGSGVFTIVLAGGEGKRLAPLTAGEAGDSILMQGTDIGRYAPPRELCGRGWSDRRGAGRRSCGRRHSPESPL